MSSKKRVKYREEDPALFFAPKTVKSCLLAWLFPGAGHWFLGRTKTAVIICVALILAFFWGILQGGDLYPLAGEGKIRAIGAFCQYGMGLPNIVARIFVGRGTPLNITYDYGSIYFLVAGMINWLCVVDAFDIAVGRK